QGVRRLGAGLDVQVEEGAAAAAGGEAAAAARRLPGEVRRDRGEVEARRRGGDAGAGQAAQDRRARDALRPGVGAGVIRSLNVIAINRPGTEGSRSGLRGKS